MQNVKTYSKRSNAARVLKKAGIQKAVINEMLVKHEGKWGFQVSEQGEPIVPNAEQEINAVQNNAFSAMALTLRSVKLTKKLIAQPSGNLKIEKQRPCKNGVSRPSKGGLCRQVWDWCDAYRSENKQIPTAKQVKAQAQKVGWNLNNASIEYYGWRRFNGIIGALKQGA